MKICVIGGNCAAATNFLRAMIENKVTLAGAFRDVPMLKRFIHVRQRLVTKIICSVKTSARFAGNPASELKNLILSSSHPVVLGCTDLRVAFRLDLQKIDGILHLPSQALTGSCIRFL